MRYLTLLLLFIVSQNISGQRPGTLDPSYGVDGMGVIQAEDTIALDRFNMLILEDGKKLISGYKKVGNKNLSLIKRLNIDGDIDTQFGDLGEAVHEFDGDAYLFDIKVQEDGKIVVVGTLVYGLGQKRYYLIMRYLPTGSMDSTFGDGGIIKLNFESPNPVEAAVSLIILDDQRLLVGGVVSNNRYFGLICLNPDGSVDESYGDHGKSLVSFGANSICALTKMALQSDEKLVCIGNVSDYQNRPYFGMCRLDANGKLDNSFGKKGLLLYNYDDKYFRFYNYSLELIENDRILVGGTIHLYDSNYKVKSSRLGLLRYNKNGILETDFGDNGMVSIDIGNDYYSVWGVVKLLDSEHIVLAGTSVKDHGKPTTSNYFNVSRLNNAGKIDSAFGTNGITLTSVPNFVMPQAVAIEKNKRIVVMGASNQFFNQYKESNYYIITARYFSGLEIGTIDFKAVYEEEIYPNPVNEGATLKYRLNKPESISVSLVNIEGRRIKEWKTGEWQLPGEHSMALDFGYGILPGIYFLNISNGRVVKSIKITKSL